MTVEITGLKSVEAALNDALKDIRIDSELLLSQILQGISANTAPYVPVDTSFLINSEYRTTQFTADGARGELGFRAGYAPFVHDGPQKKWQKPGASNQFLTLGVRDFIADDLSNVLARFQG